MQDINAKTQRSEETQKSCPKEWQKVLQSWKIGPCPTQGWEKSTVSAAMTCMTLSFV